LPRIRLKKLVKLCPPRPELRLGLHPPLIVELRRLRPDDLPHHLPRQAEFPADRLDRLALHEIRPPDLRDRLHHQHPNPDHHGRPWRSLWTPSAGVPLGSRSPPTRGPYSMLIHTLPDSSEENGYRDLPDNNRFPFGVAGSAGCYQKTPHKEYVCR